MMDETPISNPFDEDEKKGSRPMLWAMLASIVLCCGTFLVAAFLYFQPDPVSLYAQYFPSSTSTPSRTPTPTPTITPTITNTSSPTPNFTATAEAVQARDTALAYQSTSEHAANTWKVIRSDTFDSNKNNWLVNEAKDDEYALSTYEVVDGKYRWEATAHKPFIAWVRADRKSLTDFYVSVDVQQTEGPETADYGIIFREDVYANFYYFGINNQGKYALFLFFEEWKTLINWTETDLIKPGQINRLTVIGEGSHFTVFINDQYLAEITDDAIRSGATALAIEMSDENDHAIFEFDNFDLRAP